MENIDRIAIEDQYPPMRDTMYVVWEPVGDTREIREVTIFESEAYHAAGEIDTAYVVKVTV